MEKLIGIIRKNKCLGILTQDESGEYHFVEKEFSDNIRSDFVMGPVWKYTNPDAIAKYRLTRTPNYNILVADIVEEDIGIINEIIQVDGFMCFLTDSPRELVNYQPIDMAPIGFYSDENICEFAMEIINNSVDVKTEIKPFNENDLFEMAEEIKRIEARLNQ